MVEKTEKDDSMVFSWGEGWTSGIETPRQETDFGESK